MGFAVSLVAILSLVSLTRAQENEIPAAAAAEADNEAVKRLEQIMELAKLTDEADQLLAAGSVDSARTRYQQVLNRTQESGPTAALNGRAKKGMGLITALQARQAMDRKDYAQSRQLWEQALALDPANTAYLAVYAQVKEKSKGVSEEYPANTAVTPELQDKVQQIQKLIFEGDSYVQTGQYVRAVARYKKVLLIDPYHNEARKRIKKTEQTMERVATVRMKQRKEEALGKVEDVWGLKPQVAVEQSANLTVGEDGGDNAANVYDKLQSIVIPQCSFTDADLADILKYLQEQSKVIDSKKEGVNFVFKGEPTGETGTAPTTQTRSLTLDLKEVSLIKILDFIQSLSTYKYKVDEYAVYVFPNTETSEVMLVRTFSVPASFFPTTIRTDDAQVGAMERRTVSMATSDVKKELSDRGVTFTAGASASYLPKTAKLVVRNTLDQLNLIEQLLSREATVSTQVEISAKFLDFSLDKVKDLSFNYLTQFNPDNAIIANTFGGIPNVPNRNLASQAPLQFTAFPQPSVTRGEFGAATALRNANSLQGNIIDSLLGLDVNRTPNMISLAGVIDGAGVQLFITALQSQLGADLLSEPKITLINGQKSKIRAVRELRYPTQWDAPKVPTSTGGGGNNSTTAVTVIPSNPTNFVMRDVGVSLDVKANATPDRRIDLDITPEVTEFQGFINYGGDATTLDAYGNIAIIVQGVALMPVFSLRSLKTKMQVVDGQTVVMGGFIRSDNQDMEDKIPVLADIPLLGRMFRSKSSQAIKRNLIIFLTARMIRPDGRYEYMTDGEKELAEITSLTVTPEKTQQ
ncbi:MAG: hypothetical protein LBK60_08345 [Verrucomicrobiales bacterium]|nr:hypothetical protein [Verrucomicrobiales bacterium]